MPELIDRHATMDAIPVPTDADEAEYYGKVCDAIEAMPTIKSEVRRGRWIKQENGLNLCSVCGVTKVSHLPCCGHCGARMDGGADNG